MLDLTDPAPCFLIVLRGLTLELLLDRTVAVSPRVAGMPNTWGAELELLTCREVSADTDADSSIFTVAGGRSPHNK